MNPIAKLFVEVGANTNNFKRGMTQVREDITSTSKQVSFFSNTLSNAIGFGLANAATAGINALSNLGKSIVATGIGFNELEQNSTVAFDTMLGSVDKAKKFIDDLKVFAKKTPFELPGLIESSQRLLAFGFDSQKIIPMMTNIGDAIAGLGGSPEKMNRVILAFGQIKAKGKLMAGEMMQLTEAGIPAWDMLAKKIGVSIPEAMKMGERGLIDADTAINAILEGMNKKFGGLMDKQSKGWTGMVSNIKDTFTQVTGRVMKPFFDLGLKGMDKLLTLFNSPVFEKFVSRVESGAKTAANFIGKLGKGLIGLFTGDYKSFFSGLFGGFDKLSGMLKKYENKRFGWLSNFTPKEALTAINGFINDLKHGGKFLDYWINHTPKLLQPLMKISVAGLKVWKYLAGEGVQLTLKKLGSILLGLGSTLSKLVRPFKDALGGLFAQLSTMKSIGFADIFKAVLASIAQAFTGFIKVIKDEFWPTIKEAFTWVFSSLWSWLTSVDWSNVWTTIVDSFKALSSFILSFDWAGLGKLVIDGFSSIVAYVQSFDWAGIWSSVKTGLSAIGGFISENILPIFSNFFSWLISWFTDSGKNQTLLSAITVTWNFISSWATTIATTIEPYLTGFFGWLFSWFTDSNKRQQLLNAVITGWNWTTSWASSIATTIAPYLSAMWQWLSSWFTDPSKNASLWQSLKNGWTAIIQWSANLWGWIQPNLVILGTNVKSWIDTNVPFFGSWIDSFINTSTQIKDDWLAKWPVLTQTFRDFSNTMKTEVPIIIETLSSLFSKFTGTEFESSGIGGYFANMIAFYTRYFGFLTKTARIALEMLDAMVDATKKAFAFDWNGYVSGSMKFGEKLSELVSHIGTVTQLGQGYASGGNVAKSGNYMVGETGPEMVTLPIGSRVWDTGQTRGKTSGGGNSVAEVHIYNESKFPIDRATVKELAIALQRELNLSGNRVVFAN